MSLCYLSIFHALNRQKDIDCQRIHLLRSFQSVLSHSYSNSKMNRSLSSTLLQYVLRPRALEFTYNGDTVNILWKIYSRYLTPPQASFISHLFEHIDQQIITNKINRRLLWNDDVAEMAFVYNVQSAIILPKIGC